MLSLRLSNINENIVDMNLPRAAKFQRIDQSISNEESTEAHTLGISVSKQSLHTKRTLEPAVQPRGMTPNYTQ